MCLLLPRGLLIWDCSIFNKNFNFSTPCIGSSQKWLVHILFKYTNKVNSFIFITYKSTIALTLINQYYYFIHRSHFNEQNNDFQPLVIILYPDGNLKTNQNTNQDNSNFSQRSGRHCPPFDVLPNFWQFNELFVKDNRIFVMHQIPQIGRIVYATNLNLEHLWNFKLDQQGTFK